METCFNFAPRPDSGQTFSNLQTCCTFLNRVELREVRVKEFHHKLVEDWMPVNPPRIHDRTAAAACRWTHHAVRIHWYWRLGEDERLNAPLAASTSTYRDDRPPRRVVASSLWLLHSIGSCYTYWPVRRGLLDPSQRISADVYVREQCRPHGLVAGFPAGPHTGS
jgi:hypothetical protein